MILTAGKTQSHLTWVGVGTGSEGNLTEAAEIFFFFFLVSVWGRSGPQLSKAWRVQSESLEELERLNVHTDLGQTTTQTGREQRGDYI